ncbi:cold shock and DUF1294 domain-containing protein [Pseudomonas sp.]|uniref:cold shock and DUF1294 domain-containing protein n=1 Tax=Pseudomonas sp. TaxID=306 RepID=UPI0028B1F236|nr:cold shock and DUF1294 domain-containing protein [Pseudomonas sp.]
MEMRGMLKSWNDDKGFGFIVPQAGGPQVFLHISAMRGERRPQPGDSVLYTLSSGQGERPRAEHARLPGLSLDEPAIRQKPRKSVEPVTRRRTRPALTAGRPRQLPLKLTLFALLCALPGWGVVQLAWRGMFWPAGAYLLLSALAFLLYWTDKRRALSGGQRTPENTLHLSELLGGWPGALVAQQAFRHKTRKLSYQLPFWLIVLLHQAFWVDWLLLGRRFIPF